MSGFIEGENRQQSTLFPERVDDYIGEESPVRVIDYFIDGLDISGLGFKTEPADTGRPGYHPRLILKIYVYGYFNQVHSSRRLEREAQRNVELMWLTGRLAPDFKTIADFRKDNGEAIRLVCREFVLLCKRANLLTDALVAIDGSKFKAVNNRDKNFTQAKMKRRIAQVESSIERYLGELDDADAAAPAEDGRSMEEKIAALKEEMDQLKKFEVRMLEAPDKQLSLTDPDARSMKSRGAGIVGYNVQTAVDAKHHLIVAHEVTNAVVDRHQLHRMSEQAKAVLGTEQLEVVADRGYFAGEEILACDESNITTYLPRPLTSSGRKRGRFTKEDFVYHAEQDEYECPAGERLIWRFTTEEKRQTIHKYWSSNCPSCSLRNQCTTDKYRRIARWEHEAVVEALDARVAASPEKMRTRRAVVEHPFGTLKSWMGYTHFLTKTLEHTSTEMSLHVLAYNMKRAMNLLAVKKLIEAI
jgi:transposase